MINNSQKIIPIVSFPRSGNTWLRFILANLFKSEHVKKVDYSNLNIIMPTEQKNIESSLLSKDAPIFLKEHYNYYDLNIDFDKSIYLKRDFRDVIQSYWTFHNNKEPLFFDNFNEFLRTYWSYTGTHKKHIESLNSSKISGKKIFIIEYEDLKFNPFKTVKNCLESLEINFSQDKLKIAIENSDYSILKKFKQNIFSKKEIKDFDKLMLKFDDDIVNKKLYNKILSCYLRYRFQFRKLIK